MPNWAAVGVDATRNPLERMRELLERLDNPHRHLPPTIHVAGTNGKGSTIAFLRAILEAAGLTVHTYTTPHLQHFNERIVLAGKEITDGELSELMDEVRVKAGDLVLPFFEATTAAAFLAFSRHNADFLLLETGLGGRLDPTNVIENPLLTVITPISYDHTDVLGESLEEIAQEKVGIMKHGAACVSALQEMRVLTVIDDKADELGVDWYGFEYDYSVEFTGSDRLKYLSKWGDLDVAKPALLGIHQYINAATAITAVKVAIPNISDENIAEGIANTKWIGRMQKVEKPYISEGVKVFVDGGHNPAAAMALATTINEWKISTVLIIGMTQGRDVAKFLEPFVGLVDFIHTVQVKSEPMPYTAEYLAGIAGEMGFQSRAFDEIDDAVIFTQNENLKAGGNIIICGSLFLVGDIIC